MHIFEVKQDRYLLRLVNGEELMATLLAFTEERKIGCGVVRGLGAAASAELTFYDLEKKTYVTSALDEAAEVAGLVGNRTRGPDGGSAVHIHTSLGKRDWTSITGHVDSLTVGPTLELDVEVFPGVLQRKFDEVIGLNLQDCYLKP